MNKDSKSNTNYPILFLKGLIMGACDVIPGVSGGTIAFISGIYETLLNSISAFHPRLLLDFKKYGLKKVWQKINGNFLLVLGSGVAISIFSFAKIIDFLLTNFAPLLWSFFFGLVIASCFFMLKEIKKWKINTLVFFISGKHSVLVVVTNSDIFQCSSLTLNV